MSNLLILVETKTYNSELIRHTLISLPSATCSLYDNSSTRPEPMWASCLQDFETHFIVLHKRPLTEQANVTLPGLDRIDKRLPNIFDCALNLSLFIDLNIFHMVPWFYQRFLKFVTGFCYFLRKFYQNRKKFFKTY